MPDRFQVRYLQTRSNRYDLGDVSIEPLRVRTLRDLVPKGRIGDLATHAAGDRYLRLGERLRDTEIVHAEELSYWFAAEAARLKARCGYKLVLTVWETLPLGASFRNPAARRRRRLILESADLYLPTTERARAALLLEGVPDERIVVSPPGIDVARFRDRAPRGRPDAHVLLSVGRLVWEKGHQDVLRAVAAVRRGILGTPPPAVERLRVKIVGEGPERSRLEAHARELGIGEAVEFEGASYQRMPDLYAEASCLVLQSLPLAGCMLGPLGMPRCFWEEQFGMVLAEAMAARLPIIASTSGAIPEVTAGSAELIAPGDWLGLAQSLVDVLNAPPDRRMDRGPELVERYSREAAAERLAAAYDRAIAAPPR
jgi:glycosyltransferase involved in cell wall biosynthesis